MGGRAFYYSAESHFALETFSVFWFVNIQYSRNKNTQLKFNHSSNFVITAKNYLNAFIFRNEILLIFAVNMSPAFSCSPRYFNQHQSKDNICALYVL